MWSLGCLAAEMLLGFQLYSDSSWWTQEDTCPNNPAKNIDPSARIYLAQDLEHPFIKMKLVTTFGESHCVQKSVILTRASSDKNKMPKSKGERSETSTNNEFFFKRTIHKYRGENIEKCTYMQPSTSLTDLLGIVLPKDDEDEGDNECWKETPHSIIKYLQRCSIDCSGAHSSGKFRNRVEVFSKGKRTSHIQMRKTTDRYRGPLKMHLQVCPSTHLRDSLGIY